MKSAKAVIDSEEIRRAKRLKAHYANTVWNKRKEPPGDWAKPLPDWLVEKNKNTLLEIKANEIKDGNFKVERTLCTIM